jgi:hypothetical protein
MTLSQRLRASIRQARQTVPAISQKLPDAVPGYGEPFAQGRGTAPALSAAWPPLSAAGLVLRRLHLLWHRTALTGATTELGGNLGDVAPLEAGTLELVLGRLA